MGDRKQEQLKLEFNEREKREFTVLVADGFEAIYNALDLAQYQPGYEPELKELYGIVRDLRGLVG